MGSKKTNYIELYIDKIVIAAAALIAVVIVFVFVLSVPKVDDMGPSEIDDTISRKAEQLRERLNDEPNNKIQYESKQKEFLALLGDSIDGEVDDQINFPLPGQKAGGATSSNYTYRVPKIGTVGKPSLAVVRMAAFVPTEELTTTVTYESAGKEIQDLDLVTVESSIDVKSLYSKFKDSFAAKNFPPEKKKEQYAKPVFAKVQLQRKTQQSDGNWSEWVDIPQTKVCYLKKNLEVPTEPSEYAIEMALVQFAKSEFRDEVLQPAVYCNAIPTDPWISPTYYKTRQVKLNKQQEEQKRLEAEAEKTKRLQQKTSQTTRETRTSPTRNVEEGGPMGGGGGGGGGGGRSRETSTSRNSSRNTRQTTTTRRTTTTERTTRTERDVKTTSNALPLITEESEFNTIRLDTETNLDTLDKLVFWAHDDTTVSGEKYQYRIRIGVFNPIAGKDLFTEDEKEYRDQVVLWSDYADTNEIVEIPQRLYFFATNLRETNNDKIVEVLVARYMLGNWVSKKYSNVKCGEEIGKADEQPDSRLANAGISTDVLDFSTGAVMVDAHKVACASKTGDYYEMLYSFDGNKIERTSIKDRNWPAKVLQTYKEINAALEADPVVLLSWEQASTDVARRSPTQPDSFDTDNNRRTTPEEGMPMMMPGMP